MRMRIETTISSKSECARGWRVKFREFGEKVASGESSKDAWATTGRCKQTRKRRLPKFRLTSHAVALSFHFTARPSFRRYLRDLCHDQTGVQCRGEELRTVKMSEYRT